MVELFKERWNAHSQYSIEKFIADLNLELVGRELNELIACEVALRADAGETIDPFDYRNRFPAHEVSIQSTFSQVGLNDILATRTDQSILECNELDERSADEIPKRLGVFEIGIKLGTGSFGVVFLGVDTETGQEMALKFPRRQRITSGDELRAFVSEAEAAQELDHEGIVSTFGVFEEQGFVFIAQQLVSGGCLRSFTESKVSQRRAATIVAKVSHALAYAHQKGITHRDLKPANILLNADASPLIADFGLAVHESAQRRLKGQRCGTPAYMSPEQVEGLAHLLDGRSDIWSLGVIMYELLVGRRPFEGAIRQDLYEEITDKHPKPPRMIRPQVDRELQRICLKCLSKPIRERYNSADELALDLQHWLDGNSSRSSRRNAVPVVPQGLRSFGPQDADFYQRLLPGPKDKDGMATDTRFWKAQLEPRINPGQDPGFRVGVIIGPSGCGKSSYVKAGLLPFVDVRKVDTMFVESTAGDTESRLTVGLQQKYPSLPESADLAGKIDLLKENLRSKGNRKLVIVIDQFEQWLHADKVFESTELVHALRHCDGLNLQCLLLVRDDFWLRISQFLNAMEIDFREGTNARRVDLFDRRHAKMVLHEFGFAFGKLPDLDQELSDDQEQFLTRAIEDLVEDDYVVCVRLALFAEMFRNRPWTTAELDKVGGASGIGVTFLKETISSDDANPYFRRNEKALRRILTGLLPVAGKNIRGHMKSYEELLAQSQLDRRAFEELMDRLDTELRMVTPTDPKFSLDGSSTSIDPNKRIDWVKHFQLTHDYLVPSIREWLTSEKRRTKKGRAEIRLNELAEFWDQKSDANFIPGTVEYVALRMQTKPADWNDKQAALMKKASRIHIFRAAMAAACLAILGLVGFLFMRNFGAQALHEELLSSNISQVPKIVEKIQPYQYWVEPIIEKSREKLSKSRVSPEGTSQPLSPEDERKLLHLHMVQLSLGNSETESENLEYLKERLLISSPEEFQFVRDALFDYREKVSDWYWEQTNQEQNVLRSGAALALFDPDNPRWGTSLAKIAHHLVNAPAIDLATWKSFYEPKRDQLLPVLSDIYADTSRPTSERQIAFELILNYDVESPEFLVDALQTADLASMELLVEKLRSRNAERLIQTKLEAWEPTNWHGGLESKKTTTVDRALAAKLKQLRGLLTPDFAIVSGVSQNEFDTLQERLNAHGYRVANVRLAPGSSQELTFSAVWHPGNRETKVTTGSLEEVKSSKQEMEANQFHAVDVNSCLAIKPNSSLEPQRIYSVVWRESGDQPATHIQFEVAEDAWQSVSEGVALTGFGRLDRKCMWKQDSGQRMASMIWSKTKSTSTLFEPKSPRPAEYVGQLQIDLQECDDQAQTALEIWRDSKVTHSLALFEKPHAEHQALSEKLADEGYIAQIVCARFEGSEQSISSVWHRPIIAEPIKEELSEHRANLAIALLKLDPQSEIAWRELRNGPDARVRTRMVHRFSELQISPSVLLAQLGNEKDASIRRALLLALGEYDWDAVPAVQRETARVLIVKDYCQHDDAGVHSAALWLMKQWNWQKEIEKADQLILTQQPDLKSYTANSKRKWYVNDVGLTLNIIDGGKFIMGTAPWDPDIGEDEKQQWKIVDRCFALAAFETTCEQFLEFARETKTPEYITRPEMRFQITSMDCPATGFQWFAAAKFCNWMSEKNGIPEDQWCYEPNSKGEYAEGMTTKENSLELEGYRLPTAAEWEFACRAGALTSRHFGYSEKLLEKYGWFVGNCDRKTWPVGSLKPNDFGLFDMHGNLWEWCHGVEEEADEQQLYDRILKFKAGRAMPLRGGGYRDPAYNVRCHDINGMRPSFLETNNTIRIARTMPTSN